MTQIFEAPSSITGPDAMPQNNACPGFLAPETQVIVVIFDPAAIYPRGFQRNAIQAIRASAIALSCASGGQRRTEMDSLGGQDS